MEKQKIISIDGIKEEKKKTTRCFCETNLEDDDDFFVFDADGDPILGIDGKNGAIAVRINKEGGMIGIPIDYCPFCGKKFNHDDD